MNFEAKEFYRQVYNKNLWGSTESASGHGSDRHHTQELIAGLRPLMDRNGITSILDCPCGDWAWMRHVNLSGIDYIGGDIVDEIVADNRSKFDSHGVKFKIIDILKDDLPDVDMILVRDMFIHFQHNLIHAALSNIQRSGIKYILTTHHTNRDAEWPEGKLFIPEVQELGGDAHGRGFDHQYRPIHFMAPPYNWPEPIEILMEAAHAWDGYKSLALWKIDDLPKY